MYTSSNKVTHAVFIVGEAAANPIQLRLRGGLRPGQVTDLSQGSGYRQPFTLTFAPIRVAS